MTPQKTTTYQKKQRKTKKAISKKTPVQQTQTKVMPVWLRIVIICLISIVVISVFYFFFIRPYSYRWKPCYGLKGYGVCIPCCYDVHGVDISHYQGSINWPQLISHNNQSVFPIEFMFIKATEGGDHSDKNFVTNFDAAKKYGFIRGAYHFFSPHTDPIKQAEHFIKSVKLSEGDLPPVLDIELIGRNSSKELSDKALKWLDRVESHYGVKPIIYTSYKFKMKHLSDEAFNKYPYWIAHYYVDSVRYEGKWDFWQHTDIGIVPGIEHDVDLNVFNGTLEKLRSLTIK